MGYIKDFFTSVKRRGLVGTINHLVMSSGQKDEEGPTPEEKERLDAQSEVDGTWRDFYRSRMPQLGFMLTEKDMRSLRSLCAKIHEYSISSPNETLYREMKGMVEELILHAVAIEQGIPLEQLTHLSPAMKQKTIYASLDPLHLRKWLRSASDESIEDIRSREEKCASTSDAKEKWTLEKAIQQDRNVASSQVAAFLAAGVIRYNRKEVSQKILSNVVIGFEDHVDFRQRLGLDQQHPKGPKEIVR